LALCKGPSKVDVNQLGTETVPVSETLCSLYFIFYFLFFFILLLLLILFFYFFFCKTARWTKSKHPVISRVLIFWEITPCSPVEVHSHFGGPYRLRFQGVKKAHTQQDARCKHVTCFDYSSTPKMEVVDSSETSTN
jgi:hypothetical protein